MNNWICTLYRTYVHLSRIIRCRNYWSLTGDFPFTTSKASRGSIIRRSDREEVAGVNDAMVRAKIYAKEHRNARAFVERLIAVMQRGLGRLES